jgi:beta-galactosidase
VKTIAPWTIAAAALLALGCAGEDLTFPKGFLFGTATAGFQVEMGCPKLPRAECEDPNSDWYAFITTPSLVQDPGLHIAGDPPTSGPGFYELYADDVARAAGDLHGNSLRVSLEWSRVFPTSTVGIDDPAALKQAASPKGLAFYHALFAAMRERGLTPFVTIDHYTLPRWIHDTVGCHQDLTACTARGWVDEDKIVPEIAKYAGFAAREFGGEVDLWATENEPLTAVILPSYLFQSATRTNPPAVPLRTDEAKLALVSEIVAHARMYDAVKANDTQDADGDGRPARIGLVYNLETVSPDNPDDQVDKRAVTNATYLLDQLFLDATVKGDLDAHLDGTTVHRDDLAGRMDFIAVNYYARLVVQGTPSSFLPAISPLLTFNPLSMTYDYEYPKGIYDVLTWAHRYGLPLLISETGVEDAGDSGKASAWIVETLTWVKRAIAEGVPVEGYFYWTLMDNYEWNHGMQVRMGLYAVDPADATKARRPRSAVGTYGAVARDGRIPPDLAQRYPAPRN